jgi:hypothetical protein
MVLHPFCDPYVWENPLVLTSMPLTVGNRGREPCASEYVNQVIFIYLIMILFAAALNTATQSPFVLPASLALATILVSPSLWSLTRLRTMREGFSSPQSGKLREIQQAIRDTQEKINFLRKSLTDTALNETESNAIKGQIAQLTASMEVLKENSDALEDMTESGASGSVVGSTTAKAERYPLSMARDVYDVIGKGAAPANLMLPTAKNPFMNVLIDQIKYNPTRPLAASILDPSVKVTLEEFFRTDFYSDPTDVFGKTQSQRQFVTMPSTGIPNDVDSYQNWLYRIPGKTCKEGGREACLPGTDGGALPWLNVNP